MKLAYGWCSRAIRAHLVQCQTSKPAPITPSQILVRTLLNKIQSVFQIPTVCQNRNSPRSRPWPRYACPPWRYYRHNWVILSWKARRQSVACAFCSVRISKPPRWAIQNLRCPLTSIVLHFSSLSAKTISQTIKTSLSWHPASRLASSWGKRQVYPRQVRTRSRGNLLAEP